MERTPETCCERFRSIFDVAMTTVTDAPGVGPTMTDTTSFSTARIVPAHRSLQPEGRR